MVLGTQFWHVSESRYFCYCQGLNLIAIEPNLPGMVFLLYEAFHRATSKSGFFHEINHPAIFRGSLMTMETCIYSQFFSQIPMSPAMPPEYNLPICQIACKNINSLLVNVDIPIDTKRLLVGGFNLPLWKMWKSIGMIKLHGSKPPTRLVRTS